MAWLDKRGNSFRVVFQVGGHTFKRSLRTTDRREAAGRIAAVERRIAMVERGELAVPDGVDLTAFLVDDGKAQPLVVAKPPLTLKELIDSFRSALPPGSIEANSLYTLNIHLAHVLRVLRPTTPLSNVTFETLQQYVNARSKATGRRGQPISATTIKKELSSFSSVWNWALRMGHVSVPFPNKGLRYPKGAEKPPFQTWKEIQRQIGCGGLTKPEEQALWDCLYLRVEEVEKLLTFVKEHAVDPCLYPMLLMAAHTGARRSEIVRALKRDFDFEAGTVLLREKKRAKGRTTHRTVPMTETLAAVMKDWLATQPSSAAFTEGGVALTPQRASELLTRTLAGSPWAKIRGWHVLRHSFISNLASRAVDQRLIDEFVGHTTDQMRERYRHLFPETKRAAIAAVFG
jgi:integrase